MKIEIDIGSPIMDEQVQNLILVISNKYFGGDIEEAADYFNLMSQCCPEEVRR